MSQRKLCVSSRDAPHREYMHDSEVLCGSSASHHTDSRKYCAVSALISFLEVELYQCSCGKLLLERHHSATLDVVISSKFLVEQEERYGTSIPYLLKCFSKCVRLETEARNQR